MRVAQCSRIRRRSVASQELLSVTGHAALRFTTRAGKGHPAGELVVIRIASKYCTGGFVNFRNHIWSSRTALRSQNKLVVAGHRQPTRSVGSILESQQGDFHGRIERHKDKQFL